MPRRRRRVASLDGIVLFPPSWQSFVEHLMIAPAQGVEDVAGPPGQRVRAGSIEDDASGLRDLPGRPRFDRAERHVARALDVEIGVLGLAADVDDVDLHARIDLLLELVDLDERYGAL